MVFQWQLHRYNPPFCERHRRGYETEGCLRIEFKPHKNKRLPAASCTETSWIATIFLKSDRFINGDQRAELPAERLTQLCFRQVQMIRIGEDCQSVGKVDHILMKAAGRILRISEFIDDHADDLLHQNIALIGPWLFALQIEPNGENPEVPPGIA